MGHGNLRGAELPQWVGDAAGYHAIHARLKNYRGRARDHACVGCGKGAAQWAYDLADPHEKRSPEGLAYSTDLSRYLPMCGSCHRHHDTTAAGKAACGTDAGYYRHRRRGTAPCQLCKDAHTAATRRRINRRTLTDPDQEPTP